MKIGAILIRLRNERQLTQKEVAEFIGVRQNTYQSWESDHTSVKVDYLPLLAEIFGVNVVELLPTTQEQQNSRQKARTILEPAHPSNYQTELLAHQKRTNQLLEELLARFKSG